MTPPTPLDVALACAARGWAVFPCNAKKAPLTKNGFKDASCDEAAVRRFWQLKPKAMVGVATGASGLVVVDIDTKGEVDGYDGWHGLVQDTGADLEQTTLVETPSGGMHVYYQTNGFKVGSTAGKLAPGIDTRAEGGYVIAAGSPGYSYVDGHGPELLAPLPAVLADRLAYASERKKQPLIPPEALRIPQGRRDSTLASLAGRLRRGGSNEATILAALVQENNDRCDPPLPAADLERIAHSVGRYTPDAATVAAPTCGGADLYTERGNARRFVQDHAGRVAYVDGWGWRVYRDGYFADDKAALVQLAHRTVDALYAEASACTDEKARKTIDGWAKRSSSLAGVKNLLGLAEAEPGVVAAPHDFDTGQGLLGTPAGVLALDGPQLRPHSASYRLTKQIGTTWDPDARCDTWLEHLDVIFQGDIALITFMQRWAGRALSGLTPSDNCRILLAYGTGANGKTVTVETLAAVLGSYAMSTDFQTWCTGSGGGGEVPHPELARLAGARLVRSTESGHAHRLDESVLKLYTGGEEVTPRLLYQSAPVAYRPQFSLLLSTNHLPRLEGSDVGFWRRFLKVGFDYTIPEPDRDTGLMARLHRELPGVLRWCVDGYLQWRERGLDPPLSVLYETAEYRNDIDLVGQFMAERLEPAAGGAAELSGAVYPAYRAWAEGMGVKPLASNTLAQRLKEHGLKIGKDGHSRRSVLLDQRLSEQRFSALGVPL